ncbi:hypothetical protein V8E51_003831 [Hyaloscypha variabilis]
MYSYGILYIAIFARLLTPALATPTPEPSQLTLTIETYGGKGLEDLQCMGWLCAATPPPCWEYPDGPWSIPKPCWTCCRSPEVSLIQEQPVQAATDEHRGITKSSDYDYCWPGRWRSLENLPPCPPRWYSNNRRTLSNPAWTCCDPTRDVSDYCLPERKHSIEEVSPCEKGWTTSKPVWTCCHALVSEVDGQGTVAVTININNEISGGNPHAPKQGL